VGKRPIARVHHYRAAANANGNPVSAHTVRRRASYDQVIRGCGACGRCCGS